MRSKNSCGSFRVIRGLVLIASINCGLVACDASQDAQLPHAEAQLADSSPRATATVSGVSSGGYMAVQTHIALADKVAGAGIVAGGPYHCAAGSVSHALGRCLSGDNLDVAPLITFTHEAAASGRIAATENLQDARVWLFHSGMDQVVGRKVVAALSSYYLEFLPADQIKVVDNIDAAHGWPTLDSGSECLTIGGDFINACNFDTAGTMLKHLYVNLNPRVPGPASADMTEIDLSAYVEAGIGMSDTAFIFVPRECRQRDAGCRLHVAFHGCRQGREFIDDRFVKSAGYNEWAEQNRIVVIYPQVESSTFNPQGCWDWWGYTGAQYDQKSGKQIAVIDEILTAFSNEQLLDRVED